MPGPLVAGALLQVGTALIERLFPDPKARAEAEIKLLAMQREGELKELELGLSAINSEAQSADPWTSRARPSFLYVMYLMILGALPMGVLHALQPDLAVSIADGAKAWLEALPEALWWLFGSGYLGYAAVRTQDKKSILDKLSGGAKR